MSEEILKALMQLFAIISKQDDGVSTSIRLYVENFLKYQLTESMVEEYLLLFDEFSAEKQKDKREVKPVAEGETPGPLREERAPKRTSVLDSVRTLTLCKKINKTLSQKQKVVVLIRLWELIRAEEQFTQQRIEIINTVANAFNISDEEFHEIENFCAKDDRESNNSENVLFIEDVSKNESGNSQFHYKLIDSDGLDGRIAIIHVPSVELYFVKYNGDNEIFLNGLVFNNKSIYLFPQGSTLRLPQEAIFYSDIVSRFINNANNVQISFNVKDLNFKFPNGAIGLNDINISEDSGKLVAIMGGSGSGKTTLLNVLSGIEKPSAGSVILNSINIHTEPKKTEGLIGYIAQDDLLIEELTVFENLYYNAKLCFSEKTEAGIVGIVNATLTNLGLFEIKDIKVGNPLNKKISGGQRKRLNIGLELIREPEVLFVDEPTSGLSSRDSENVMDLLKELSLKGKLIFIVIHQPSSDIYKMFDRLFFLDAGGYPVYYGNPIEAVMYFKHQTNQVKADVGECHACGNVNPELLFNLLEAKVVDDYGRFTGARKIKPVEWYKRFKNWFKPEFKKDVEKTPENILSIPNWFGQLKIFTQRDVKSKITNTQYLLINLLEAPLLAFILAILIRYVGNQELGKYTYYDNENMPAYMFICIIVSLFIGLTVSAEEIFRDRKILKREQFLNLSKSSYLFSKLGILFTLSAIQSLLFVLVGNVILGVQGMYFSYWLVLFTVSCFANVLGLNISVTFNSAVTIYIIIPLLVIPQMILGGAMFSFDKINNYLGGGKEKTPLIADFFASRWAFEALAVNQFKENKFEKPFYLMDKIESALNYKQAYYIPRLQELVSSSKNHLKAKDDTSKKILASNLSILKQEISSECNLIAAVHFDSLENLIPGKVTRKTLKATDTYLEELNGYYSLKFNQVEEQKNNLIAQMQETPEKLALFNKIKQECGNENLSDLVTKANERYKIRVYNNRLVQNSDPVFRDPSPKNAVDFRAHFFAPRKCFYGKFYSTFHFNVIIIWFMSILLYLSLYFEIFVKIFKLIDGFKRRFT